MESQAAVPRSAEFLGRKQQDLAKLKEELAALRQAHTAASEPVPTEAPPPPPTRTNGGGVTFSEDITDTLDSVSASPPPPPPPPLPRTVGGEEADVGDEIGQELRIEFEDGETTDYTLDGDDGESSDTRGLDIGGGESDYDNAQNDGTVLIKRRTGAQRSMRPRREGAGTPANQRTRGRVKESVSNEAFLQDWRRKFERVQAAAQKQRGGGRGSIGLGRMGVRRGETKSGTKQNREQAADVRTSSMHFSTHQDYSSSKGPTLAALARAQHRYSETFSPLPPSRSPMRSPRRMNGAASPGSGAGSPGSDGSVSSPTRPRWVGMTRRNSVIGGNQATEAMWHQLGATESEDHLQALAEVRAHQEAAHQEIGEAATISVTVPAHILNPYLFVRQVEAQTKKDAVKQNLANLERRRRQALKKEAALRARSQAEEENRNAEDKARLMLLRARGANGHPVEGADSLGMNSSAGSSGDSPKFRDMSFHRDNERGHDSKGLVAWHESPQKGKGRGTHRAALEAELVNPILGIAKSDANDAKTAAYFNKRSMQHRKPGTNSRLW